MASDKVFFNNFMMILGGLVAFTIIILILARILGGPTDGAEVANDPQAQTLLANRIKPIGDVAISGLNTTIFDDASRALDEPPVATAQNVATTVESAANNVVASAQTVAATVVDTAQASVETVADTAAAGKSGKEVYDSACFACHMTGVAGAPKFGDAAAWAPRVAKGIETLQANSINGLTGDAGVMPAKGGRVDLSDDEVRAAVQYMVDNIQ